MLKRLLAGTVLLAFALALVASPARANVGPSPTVDGDIAKIYAWYGGKVSKAQIRDVAQARANQMSMSLLAVLEKVIAEAVSAWPSHACKNSDGTYNFKAKYKLKTAKRAATSSSRPVASPGSATLAYTTRSRR